MALEFAIGREDVQILHDLNNVLRDSKIEVLSKATDFKLQSYIAMFKDMTLDEANQIIQRHDSNVALKQTSEADRTVAQNLTKFNLLVQSTIKTVEKDILSGELPKTNPSLIASWEEDHHAHKQSRIFSETAEDENEDDDR